MADETPRRPKSTSWSVDPKEIAGHVTFLMFPPLEFRITNHSCHVSIFSTSWWEDKSFVILSNGMDQYYLIHF